MSQPLALAHQHAARFAEPDYNLLMQPVNTMCSTAAKMNCEFCVARARVDLRCGGARSLDPQNPSYTTNTNSKPQFGIQTFEPFPDPSASALPAVVSLGVQQPEPGCLDCDSERRDTSLRR